VGGVSNHTCNTYICYIKLPAGFRVFIHLWKSTGLPSLEG
jgi:hypothetical protein